MELFSLGKLRDLLANASKADYINSSVSNKSVLGGVLNLLPLFIFPVFSVITNVLRKSVRFFKVSSGGILDSLELRLFNTLRNELVSVLVSSTGHSLYNLVHEGLSETRVIKLIMSHFAVSNQVNDHILVEGLTVLSSILKYFSYILNAVSVNVEDGGVDALSNVRGVDSRSSLIRGSSKSNLIVNDNVNSSSYVVIL